MTASNGRMLNRLVVGQILPFNPASSVRGPKHVVKRGKTPVLSAKEDRTMSQTNSPVGPDRIDASDRQWRTARTVNTPAARSYAEWTLLVQDLGYALSRARLWKEAALAASRDESRAGVAVSLFRDAVISFVSCFDRQTPVHLDPAVAFGSLNGAVELFEWLRDMRNSWVAHRSGPLRLCVPAIVIDEQTGDVQGVGHLSHHYLGDRRPRRRTTSSVSWRRPLTIHSVSSGGTSIVCATILRS